MTPEEAREDVTNKIKLIFDTPEIEEAKFSYYKSNDKYYIEIKEEYKDLYREAECGFMKLLEIRDIIGTNKFNFTKDFTNGFCDTCEFGSGSELMFEIIDPTNELFLKCFDKN